MREELERIEREALAEVAASGGRRDALEAVQVKYLGRKGLVNELFKKIAAVPAEERASLGASLNALKNTVGRSIEDALASAASSSKDSIRKIDVTLPGVYVREGSVHPVTRTLGDIVDVFVSLGFKVVEGPEIETEHYNFEMLNIPLEHPSRDAFDTFYVTSSSGKHLLRSHTSPVQARFMERNKPPFSIVVPGTVFRPDATDASHSFMFHQVEGLVVGDRITFADLKGVLTLFARQVFGAETKMRFRPSFFPFTEPSAEVDISCNICGASGKDASSGKRCSVCGGSGWLEILGAGMVNPKVFKNAGYDPKGITGFAFGMGVERIAMLKHGIRDIRFFFENDIRFLRQF